MPETATGRTPGKSPQELDSRTKFTEGRASPDCPDKVAAMTDQIRLALFDRLADAAAAAILPHFRSALIADNKADTGFDPVTEADRGAEQAIRALIAEAFPDDGICGEEFGEAGLPAEHVWYIDPIDGTRSFIAGVPIWGTLIGLARAGRPAIGMMVQPFTGEHFVGDGTRAWYRGPGGPRDLACRPCVGLDEAILFTTDPKMFNAAERPRYDAVEGAVRLARYGCDCYAYCMLAAGLVDLVIESDLNAYDIMPLVPIVEGAGGVITDWTGAPVTGGGAIVAAGDARTHRAALALLGG
jgi:myo-inositol-1(or 4)-monophosphatase